MARSLSIIGVHHVVTVEGEQVVVSFNCCVVIRHGGNGIRNKERKEEKTHHDVLNNASSIILAYLHCCRFP